MSIIKSYFSKNNTIIQNSYTNTGRNPVMDLYFGKTPDIIAPTGFSRFIFDLDLSYLQSQLNSGVVSTGCTTAMTHTLTMYNTVKFDNELLNTTNSDGRRRATSFELILFRIPLSSGATGNSQYWDEGVGYDYYYAESLNSPSGTLSSFSPEADKNFSERPSNWFQRTTISGWSENGIYNNINSGTNVNYNELVIVDTQYFEFGDEDINFDMTDEINGILFGTITGVTGWGIAFVPQVENITGLTENYSVQFFTRHTQTFYEPFLTTTYNDLIQDNRNNFVEKNTNKLYLYTYVNGDFVNLDETPLVKIYDNSDTLISPSSGYTTCLRTKGVYEVQIPPISGYSVPCQFTDVWTNIKLNGNNLPNITNEFTLRPYKSYYNFGIESKQPEIYGFDFSGILQDEKILNTDIRKVSVNIKKAYTASQVLNNITAYYRVYVKEGQTEVQVQDWTLLNRTPNEYYFIFDTVDKIPNEYFIDLKVNSSGEVNTYKKQIKFQIVNKK